jgi:DNA-binding CsgD family transcriptional regulator
MLPPCPRTLCIAGRPWAPSFVPVRSRGPWPCAGCPLYQPNPSWRPSPHTRRLFEQLRQTEVLRLVAAGLTHKQVRAKLALSEVTVRYHMGEIPQLLHLEHRSQVIASVCLCGSQPPEPPSLRRVHRHKLHRHGGVGLVEQRLQIGRHVGVLVQKNLGCLGVALTLDGEQRHG